MGYYTIWLAIVKRFFCSVLGMRREKMRIVAVFLEASTRAKRRAQARRYAAILRTLRHKRDQLERRKITELPAQQSAKRWYQGPEITSGLLVIRPQTTRSHERSFRGVRD
jgi:hypothetical protein